MLNNIPQVTKNLLILNIMFFVATIFLGTQGIDLSTKIQKMEEEVKRLLIPYQESIIVAGMGG